MTRLWCLDILPACSQRAPQPSIPRAQVMFELDRFIALAYSKVPCSCGAHLEGEEPCRCPNPLRTWPEPCPAGNQPRDVKDIFHEWKDAHSELSIQKVDPSVLHGAMLTGNRVVVVRTDGAFITTASLAKDHRRGNNVPGYACEDARNPGRLIAGRSRPRLISSIPISTVGLPVNR